MDYFVIITQRDVDYWTAGVSLLTETKEIPLQDMCLLKTVKSDTSNSPGSPESFTGKIILIFILWLPVTRAGNAEKRSDICHTFTMRVGFSMV